MVIDKDIEQTIVHSGFAIWSVACGLISTITPGSRKVELVIFMLLAGCGAGQTLQTTTVAAQASVPRKDMSVVTAFRNFIRLLGGTLALAVDSTIINNSLRAAMNSASLPSSIIDGVIDNPAQLAQPTSIGISSTVAKFILNDGYRKGFRTVFIVNASLTSLATIASIVLIKHKELTRGDEKDRMQEKHPMAAKPRPGGDTGKAGNEEGTQVP